MFLGADEYARTWL